ncbi:MAG TPA: DUF4124 domain-containing protein [Usitatibacter sp.]|nr:DUF4124 domain-containing protein [Usitatibacter sp.]
MKTVWVAGCILAFSASAAAETTIYKLVDENGRVTYSNKPMKGAMVMELDPLTTLPTPPAVLAAKATLARDAAARTEPKAPAPAATPMQTSLASIDVQTQRRRDDARRRILEDELSKEQQALDQSRTSLTQEQQNPELVAAVRMAQNAVDPSPAQQQQLRDSVDKASGRIRGLQASVAEHEKNVEALQKELGALKP